MDLNAIKFKPKEQKLSPFQMPTDRIVLMSFIDNLLGKLANSLTLRQPNFSDCADDRSRDRSRFLFLHLR